MEITFFSVGQGDTIALNWAESPGEERCGIIDCFGVAGFRAVRTHLAARRLSRIEFVLLTHTHYDHYSGLPELLEHCEEAGIVVERFFHTEIVGRAYIAAITSQVYKIALIKLFHLVSRLERCGVIKRQGLVNPDFKLDVGSGLCLQFVAPASREYDVYMKQQFGTGLALTKRPSPNTVAAITMIGGASSYALLTSDAEQKTLGNVQGRLLLNDRREVALAQIPHHGSIKSHRPQFWSKRPRKTGAPAVVSFGENSHGHPSPDVLDSFRGLGYRVAATGPLEAPSEASMLLDMISTRTERPGGSDVRVVYRQAEDRFVRR